MCRLPGGIAAAPEPSGRFVARYTDALSLLPQTPAFLEDAVVTRLDRVFEDVHRYGGQVMNRRPVLP